MIRRSPSQEQGFADIKPDPVSGYLKTQDSSVNGPSFSNFANKYLPKMFSTSIAAIAGFAALTMAVAPDLSGSGHIIVLDGTNGITNNQTIADKIGCINADGFLTLNDCAVFSNVKSNPMTNAGVSCNFQDESQPLNVDSKYGEQDQAYQCYKGAESEPWPFYSIVSYMFGLGNDRSLTTLGWIQPALYVLR